MLFIEYQQRFIICICIQIRKEKKVQHKVGEKLKCAKTSSEASCLEFLKQEISSLFQVSSSYSKRVEADDDDWEVRIQKNQEFQQQPLSDGQILQWSQRFLWSHNAKLFDKTNDPKDDHGDHHSINS